MILFFPCTVPRACLMFCNYRTTSW